MVFFFALGFHPLSYNAQHHHTSQLGFWRRRRCRRRRCRRQPMKSLTINTVSLQRTNEPNKKKPTANCTSIRTIASSVVATAQGWRRHIDGSTHTWTRAYRPFSSCVSVVALFRAFFRALSHTLFWYCCCCCWRSPLNPLDCETLSLHVYVCVSDCGFETDSNAVVVVVVAAVAPLCCVDVWECNRHWMQSLFICLWLCRPIEHLE